MTMLSPMYPSDEDLQVIESWPPPKYEELLEYVQRRWYYGENYCQQQGSIWVLNTGGWSGNESLVAALRANHVFWSICWMKSERGGRYEFDIPDIEDSPLLREIPQWNPLSGSYFPEPEGLIVEDRRPWWRKLFCRLCLER